MTTGKSEHRTGIIKLLSLALLLICLLALAALAKQDELTTEKITDNVWVVYGGNGRGANVGVLISEKGLLLVDAMKAETHNELIAAIRTISDKPIKYVIQTHSDNDHAGGVRLIKELGATSIAHENTRYEGRVADLYFNKEFALDLGNETLKVVHTVSHSFSDALIYLEKDNVVFMGDTFTNSWYATYNSGGVDGQLDAIDKALAFSDDITVVVPGHGILSNDKGLIQYKENTRKWLAELQKQHGAGSTIDQLAANPQIDDIVQAFIDPSTGKTIPPNRFRRFIERSISADLVAGQRLSTQKLQSYTGTFQFEDGSQDQIYFESDKLYIRREKPYQHIAELIPLSDTRFHFRGGLGAHLEIDNDGNAIRIVTQQQTRTGQRMATYEASK